MTKANNLKDKGIIVATQEKRVVEWINEYLKPCVHNHKTVKYATNESEFNTLLKLPEMGMAFIEVDFLMDEIVGQLISLRKRYPTLQVILFSVSDTQPEYSGRYMTWGCDSFISLRDPPNQVREQIKVIFKGYNTLSADVLFGIRDYNRQSFRPPHFTPREIEIIRCVGQEKTIEETARMLGIKDSTVANNLNTLYRKCGVNNRVGLLKAGFTAGILYSSDLNISFRPKTWEE